MVITFPVQLMTHTVVMRGMHATGRSSGKGWGFLEVAQCKQLYADAHRRIPKQRAYQVNQKTLFTSIYTVLDVLYKKGGQQ